MCMRLFVKVMVLTFAGLSACGGGDSTGPANTGGTGGTGGGGGLAANTVQALTSSQFNPVTLNVSQNTVVTFIFFATTHNVTFDPVTGRPANVPNSANTSVTRAFTTQGTFTFQCTLHSGMTGSVVVGP